MNKDSTMNGKTIARICLAGLLLAAVPLSAAANVTKDWVEGDGNWGNDGKWIPSGVPVASDTAGFGGTSDYSINLGNLSPGITGLVFSNTGTTTFLTVQQNSRTLSIGAGGVVVNQGAGPVVFSGVLNEKIFPRLVADQEWRNDSANTLTVGGAINVPADDFRTLTVTGSGDMVVVERIGADWGPLGSLVKSGAGTLRSEGPVFTNDGIAVESGTLIVNGAPASPVTVSQSGTLGGTGSFGSTFVAGGLEPGGNGTGLMTFQALELEGTAVTTIDIAGAARGDGYDALDINGALILGGTMHVVFREGFEPTGPHAFNLFNAGGGISGGFANLNLPPLADDWRWDTSALATSGDLSVVPSALSDYWVDSDRYRVLKVRMRNMTGISEARVYWATADEPEFSEERSVEFAVGGPRDHFQVYHIPLYRHDEWGGGRQVIRMKIDDPSGTLGERVIIEYVHLKETMLQWQDLRFSREEDGEPNSERRKYFEPDLLAQWERTRQVVDHIKAPSPRIPGTHFGDVLNEAGITASVNVPPLAPMHRVRGDTGTLLDTGVERPETVYLQSVLSRPDDGVRPFEDEEEMQRRYDYVIQAAEWLKENHPDIKLGISCALWTKNQDYKKFYSELKRQLEEAGDFRIHSVVLDSAQNYANDYLGAGPGYNARFWGGMKEYARFVREEMEWRAYAIVGHRYTPSTESFHYHTLEIPQLFRDHEAVFDGYIIQYWWNHPNREIPEADPEIYSATRTILGIFEDISYPHMDRIMMGYELGPPLLSIRRTGGNQVRLSWPATAVEWTLQQSSGLDEEFTDSSLPVALEGPERAAYDTIEAPKRFYRLAR